MIKGTRTRPS